MKDELITFDTAKLASEKGFKLGIGWHGFEDKFFTEIGEPSNNHRGGNLCRPTQSLLQKWLLLNHSIDCWIMLNMNNEYSCHIYKNKLSINKDKDLHNFIVPNDKDPYKALEKGLQEALKLI